MHFASPPDEKCGLVIETFILVTVLVQLSPRAPILRFHLSCRVTGYCQFPVQNSENRRAGDS